MPAISYPNMSIHNRTRQNGQAGIDVEILGLGCPRPDQLSMRKNAFEHGTRRRAAGGNRAIHLVFPIGSFARSGLVEPSAFV
jgi:hypothetical protein